MPIDTISLAGGSSPQTAAIACRIDPDRRAGEQPPTRGTSRPPILELFLDRLAARDFEGLAASLAPAARLRTLVPAGSREYRGRARAVGRFVDWFDDATRFELVAPQIAPAADRWLVAFRIDLDMEGGRYLVEQHLFCDLGVEGIDRIDLLCSGFLPILVPGAAGVHRYDAGTLGCADGLAGWFRARLGQIPVGDALVVIARDPAAREDLPSLARLLGHDVVSATTNDDGHLEMTVKRGR
jgi:TusA-related sulfurtransferase